MLVVNNTFISDSIFKEHFVCDISCCKGSCCIEGDAGAPLEEEEITIMEGYLDKIKPFMTKDGIEVVERVGVFDYDGESLVTPLIRNLDCVFVYYEHDAAYCAIEKAFREGEINFQKPISCHLYPVRIIKHRTCEELIYHQWEICNQARINGKRLNINVFEFLKQPLTRKYGEDWVNEVERILRFRQH
ncbi:MAG: DUF3109 family protein [Bacteroidales bacterium]|jgi:hypothetical protein|nr:DUF3109 family protein [Bacteroidales bacterium]